MNVTTTTPTTCPASDLAAARSPNPTFILRALHDDVEYYYTGKAGPAFISSNITKAFPYQTLEGARRKAKSLNTYTASQQFIAVGLCVEETDLEDDYRGADAD